MSLKDLPAHNQGRRHQLALIKANANLQPQTELMDIAPAVNHRKDSQGRGIVGSAKTTSTSRPYNPLAFHDSTAPSVASYASETVTGSTFSTDTVKQKTNKAKKSNKAKQPKSIVESIAGPPAVTANEYVFHTISYSLCWSFGCQHGDL